MLDFRILGPLEVLDDDRTIELGGARQRAVLAILLLHRGETVSVDRIVDLDVGRAAARHRGQDRAGLRVPPAPGARRGRRRRARGADTPSRSTPSASTRCASSGSWTRVAPRSPTTIRRAPPSSCARRWRCGAGRRWAISPTSGSRRTAAARLEELRLAAVEERIEADLRLGRHVELVAELEGLVREHPLRERLRAQHMLALYRSGRQADALESFRDARRALVDELGLEPGRELRELEQAILTQDPALDPPRARGRPRLRPAVAAASRWSPPASRWPWQSPPSPMAVNASGGEPSPCCPTPSPSSTPRAVGWSRTCRSAPGRRRSRPTRARSGSPTSRTAPCRRSTSASGASRPRSRRTSASKGSPSAPAPPGSPTAGAAGPCAWTPTSGRWRSRCGFPR